MELQYQSFQRAYTISWMEIWKKQMNILSTGKMLTRKRFAQWAYTGEYIPAEPEFILASTQLANLKKGSASKALVDDTANPLASFKSVIENENKDLCDHCRLDPEQTMWFVSETLLFSLLQQLWLLPAESLLAMSKNHRKIIKETVDDSSIQQQQGISLFNYSL